MRKRGKRILAGFLALTLFLTSGFLILFKDSVFGAKNENYAVNPNPYINDDPNQKNALSVSVRGKDAASGNVILTDEGSNQKDKDPANKKNGKYYKGWDFTNEDGTISIPSTEGRKGTKDNPFVILEVVPDKSQQEMTCFVGGGTDSQGNKKDTGLAFDEGYMSYSLVKELRKNDPYFRFTNPVFKDNSGKSTYITNNIINKLKETYGQWMMETEYNVFNTGITAGEFTTSTSTVIDCENEKSAADSWGTFGVNEIYNISITTDDLLQVLPTKLIKSWGYERNSSKPAKDFNKEFGNSTNNSGTNARFNEYMASEEARNNRVFFEWAYEYDKLNREFYEREYTEDLVAFVAAMKNQSSIDEDTTDEEIQNYITNTSNDDIEDYIANTLSGVKLNYTELKNNKSNDDHTTNQTTEIVKYNLTDFTQADWVAPGIGQDITVYDYEDSGIFNFYDISQSQVYRGATYYTRHLDMYKKGKKGKFTYLPKVNNKVQEKEVSNYWKVQFRKKYIDTFTSTYATFLEKDKAWRQVNSESMSNTAKTLFDERNAALKLLLTAYAPLFQRKGVTYETLFDPGDWESSTKTVLSNVRKYTISKAGGYILAVKPGMGDMSLLNDSEIKKIVNNLSGDEKEAMGVNDPNYLDNTFVFTRDDADSRVDGQVPDGEDEDNGTENIDGAKRWVFVPSSFGLFGDMTPHGTYNNGYIDDDRYTFGFASKTIRNKNDISMAIYDTANRRHHGRDESNKTDITNRNKVSGFDLMETLWFNNNSVYNTRNGSISALADKFSAKMLYFSNDENYHAETPEIKRIFAHKERSGDNYLDSYHLNVWNELKKNRPSTDYINNKTNPSNWGLGISFASNEHQYIDNHDNLIEKNGTYWGGTLGTNSKGQWLFKNRNNINITGLCFDFRDVAVSNDKAAIIKTFPSIIENNVMKINFDGSTQPYLQVTPDIYSKNLISGFDYLSPQYAPYKLRLQGFSDPKKSIEQNRFIENTSNKTKSDDVSLVDPNVVVRETVTEYKFTYLGFKANPILQRSLFTFDTDAELKDFYCKVICVTPSELNQISQAAKDYNLDSSVWNTVVTEQKTTAKSYELGFLKGEYDDAEGDSDETRNQKKVNREGKLEYMSSNGWKSCWDDERLTDAEKGYLDSGKLDLNVRLDLIERADLFYIHQWRTSLKRTGDKHVAYNGQGVSGGYKFFQDITSQGASDEQIGADNRLTFFENDLEWDQVMKLIKRSSLDDNRNLPILFNMLVGNATEETVDSDNTSDPLNSKDTHMQLFDLRQENFPGQDLNSALTGLSNAREHTMQTYSGNMCNIAKLYTMLTQFDLHAVRKSTINPEETDETKRRYVRRTFMKDIFPRISQVPINTSYQPSTNKNRVLGSATMTGAVDAMSGELERSLYNTADYRSRIRVLCMKDNDNQQHKENSLYLWNKYTFYPYDIVKKDNQRAVLNLDSMTGDIGKELRIRFLEWGYLESYYSGRANSYPIFYHQSPDQAIHRRVGTDGEDGQNVFVLHWPDSYDNMNSAQSLFAYYGQGGPQTDMLLNIAYKIMSYPGNPVDLDIKARPRNKVYSLMARKENKDTLMFGFYKNKNMYTDEKFASLENKEMNILVSAFNTNSEPAFITTISLHRKADEPSDESSDSSGTTTPQAGTTSGSANFDSGSMTIAAANGDGDDLDDDSDEDPDDSPEPTATALPVVWPDDDIQFGKKIPLSELLKEDNSTHVDVQTNYAISGKKADGTDIEPGKGVLIDAGETLYFHIPYTLGDFFEKRPDGSGGYVGGYDQIVITGYYYAKNQRDHSMSIRGVKHVIDIDEQMLFELE